MVLIIYHHPAPGDSMTLKLVFRLLSVGMFPNATVTNRNQGYGVSQIRLFSLLPTLNSTPIMLNQIWYVLVISSYFAIQITNREIITNSD